MCVFIIYSFMFPAWRSKKTEDLGIFLFSAGSAGSGNVSRRGVPKIRKINDAAFSA